MVSSEENSDYKLTDLDYLIGDHHLQMIKAALPFFDVPQQRAVSVFVKFQELKKTFELFETEEVASMGICSSGTASVPRLRPGSFKGHPPLCQSHGAGSDRYDRSVYGRADAHGTAAPFFISGAAVPL